MIAKKKEKWLQREHTSSTSWADKTLQYLEKSFKISWILYFIEIKQKLKERSAMGTALPNLAWYSVTYSNRSVTDAWSTTAVGVRQMEEIRLWGGCLQTITLHSHDWIQKIRCLSSWDNCIRIVEEPSNVLFSTSLTNCNGNGYYLDVEEAQIYI